MEPMSQTEYAGYLGISQPRVSKLVATGKIPKSAMRRVDGRWKIIPELADAALAKNLDPSQKRKALSNDAAAATDPEPAAAPVPDPPADAPAPAKTPRRESRPSSDLPDISFERARTIREIARGEIEKLKLAEVRGELVRRDEVERAAFESGRALRDTILAVPDRLSAILAAEADEHQVHAMLRAELVAALSGLSDCKPEYVNFSDGGHDER